MKNGRNHTDGNSFQPLTSGVFKYALENATDAIGMSTPQGRHYYQNRAFSDLFGDVGQNPSATLYCDETTGTEVFRTIMAGGTWTGEVRMHGKDRDILTILLRAYAFKDEQGHVLGLVGIHTDITERRRAEEALRLSEMTYREIFNSINDTIWIHDVDTFDFFDVNNSVTDMFGYSVDQALALGVDDISSGVPPYTQKEAVALMKKAAAGQPQLFEWHTRHKDGHLFWTEVSLKRGVVAGKDCLLAIERDITERKRTEDNLRRIHALESLGTVAGGIAHDFNNLLMGVFGNIELAKIKLTPHHPALAPLQAAHNALENARHLTARLLTFAKGGDPVLKTVDLRQHIRETVQFHLTGSNIAAHFAIDEALWPAKADKGQIAEVISNLTINAKQACTGLGLSIVHGIVSKHNGYIGVESVPDAGTTVTVFLPADESGQSRPATGDPPRHDLPSRLEKSILLVDDEAVIRETAALMLESLGCAVDTAIDGRQAAEKYATALNRGRPYDVTIMDLTIPGGMGGKETVRRLLALDGSARVIVTSGYSSDPVLADYTRYGFCGRLVKPFDFEELMGAISRALEME